MKKENIFFVLCLKTLDIARSPLPFSDNFQSLSDNFFKFRPSASFIVVEKKLRSQALQRSSYKKSRIRETPTLWTDAASRTDTNLKRLRDIFFVVVYVYIYFFL